VGYQVHGKHHTMPSVVLDLRLELEQGGLCGLPGARTAHQPPSVLDLRLIVVCCGP